MSRYDRLLFDVDGTLLDFDAAEQIGLECVLREYGQERMEFMVARYREINHELWDAYEKGEIPKEGITDRRFNRLFQELGIQADGLETELRYREQLNRSAIPVRDAEEVCRYLSGRYEMYVVTNGFVQTQEMRMKASGLDRYFKRSFISEAVGSQKPQKEFFEYCFSHMENPEPSRMLIIGDSLKSDIRGGNTAGIDTCWFNPLGLENREGVRVNMEIRGLAELMERL